MTKPQAIDWFNEARFGMFIHWGLYSIPARGEWVRSHEKMSKEAYEPFFKEFNPTQYNPKEWARLAKEAGQQYAVLTAKHHDGFCLYDSKLTDYKSTNTPIGRDLVREFLEAFRAEGLKVGLYYSLLDWHHEDYPHYGDLVHPMRENEEFKGKQHAFDRYLDYMHGQVRELMTDYGQLDIMWFDFSYEELRGEAWRATELIRMVRELQPNILIDNRLGGNIKAEQPEEYAGDFASPEQALPPYGVLNEAGQPIPWEACITMNNHWGYNAADKDYKAAKDIVRSLVECVSKGGNLLLNVGPDAKGIIPVESVAILQEVGRWMRRNGDSIFGCGRAELLRPDWGRYTQRGNKLFAHILDKGVGAINLTGLKGKIKKARLLADGSEVKLGHLFAHHYPEDELIWFPSAKLPDDIDTVIELELMTDQGGLPK